jgi:hypothetical protein
MYSKIKTWEKFNEEIGVNWITWPSGVRNVDIEKYEKVINDMMDLEDIDDRMESIDELLQDIEDNYPDIYDDVEDDIKDLALD